MLTHLIQNTLRQQINMNFLMIILQACFLRIKNLIEFLHPQYFKTASEICEKYNCSRATLYRVLNNPLIRTKIPFRLEKVYIHSSAIDYL